MKLTTKALSIGFTSNLFHQGAAASVVCGVERGGHRGSEAYNSSSQGLGRSHAAGASLASVLKVGKEEIPTAQAAAEAESIFFQRALWKLEERIANPKESSMKRSLEGKSDWRQPEQCKLPCEQFKKWCRKHAHTYKKSPSISLLQKTKKIKARGSDFEPSLIN